MLAGEEAPTPAVPMQHPLHTHHASQQCWPVSSATWVQGSLCLLLPFWVSHGKRLSCIIGVTFMGQKMMLGCPAVGWEPRSVGGREGDVVSQAVEGAGLCVCDGSLLAGPKVQDLLPHPAKPDPCCCTSPRCLGPFFSCLYPKLPAVLRSQLLLRTLIP